MVSQYGLDDKFVVRSVTVLIITDIIECTMMILVKAVKLLIFP